MTAREGTIRGNPYFRGCQARMAVNFSRSYRKSMTFRGNLHLPPKMPRNPLRVQASSYQVDELQRVHLIPSNERLKRREVDLFKLLHSLIFSAHAVAVVARPSTGPI